MIEQKRVIFLMALVVVFSISLGFVSAAAVASTCWQYTTVAGGCNSTNGCLLKSDAWGDWCEQIECWSLDTQTDCNTLTVTGQNCSWQAGGSYGYCNEPECWDYSGTNETYCETNPQSLSCTWTGSCYNTGGGASCWSLSTESNCLNQTGCAWGDCQAKGCWNFANESSCVVALDPWNSRNCTWSADSSYCTQGSCYSSSVTSNKTACQALSYCSWSGSNSSGSCQEVGCWSFDGDQTACTNASTSNSIDCVWDDGWCVWDDCYSYDGNQTACNLQSDCTWKTWTTSGWCEEVRCWTWDSNHGGSNASCVGNSSLYGLDCVWKGQPTGNLTNGYCEQDYSSTNCTTISNERECYDTFYCWWTAVDWNNPADGGNCTDPDWSTVDSDANIGTEWNPGCYIFDGNSTHCNATLGCAMTGGQCDEIASGNNSDYGTNITNDGISCSYINDSGLCNAMAALSTCCSWQNGTCSDARFLTTCWNSLDETPEGADSCEDATSKNNCNTLANTPWYWPCTWDNSSTPAKCTIKSTDIWGNRTKNIVTIENRKICEAVGGKWGTENYCEGNVSVATGRCEYKFDDEDNCDKACFACESRTGSKASGGAGQQITATNAKDACEISNLGYCEFKSDTSAPNSIGYCEAKREFKEGVAEECSATNCGGCTHKGDPTLNNLNGTKTPETYCNQYSKTCDWVIDTGLDTKGYCTDKGEKRCQTACDRCETQDKCVNDGRTDVSNKTGSCKWQGSDTDGSCVPNVAGEVEICWNGEDDDDDGLYDCADPGCYADTFCGFVDGDCFVWQNEGNCTGNSCEWITDKWGSWCDFPGSQCWLYDGNPNTCNGVTSANQSVNINGSRVTGNGINESYTFSLSPVGLGVNTGSVTVTNASGGTLAGNFTVNYTANSITFTNNTVMMSGIGGANDTNVSYTYNASTGKFCEWQNGTGSGWCEQDWSVAELCWGLGNSSDCTAVANCAWTNDTWCEGGGDGSDWCATNAGWCEHTDFVHQDCWQYTGNASCTDTAGCSWRIDEWSQSQCEVNWSGNCWQNLNESTCDSGGCYWDTTWSWCGNKMEECWRATTDSACAAASVACEWDSWSNSCQPGCYNDSISHTQSSCTAVTGCSWREAGWCEEQQSAKCFNSTNANDQTACSATSGCAWRGSGWCNPVDGFSTGTFTGGGGGGDYGECWKFDGNETSCKSTTDNFTCGWFAESSAFCEVDWDVDCWEYLSIAGGCNATNNCWWNQDNSYCTNVKEQCWQNTTLVANATTCNANAHCNSTSFGCEPNCFSATTSATCDSGCTWITGWCNAEGTHEVFDQIEGGVPTPIVADTCPESSIVGSVDICGVGIKDMGDAFGFGANVVSLVNSSICNKEKVGSFTFGGTSDVVGAGNETVQLIVYLDTDGSTTGGCALEHDSTAVGYEFKLRYRSIWNATNSKTVETLAASKCNTDTSKWKTSDIKINSWKKLMCSDIGGPMIAVEKSELSRFQTLYNSTKDMRIYMSTSGNTGNATSPSDTAGPGWATPGAIDFEIASAFEFGADGAKFENILKKGFVQYEDCWNGIDDDNDDAIDCSDWDCQFNPTCTTTGVNVDGYADTRMAKVTGVKIEEYNDSALILYDTNKPANGSLSFFGNDSTCTTLNATINDIGIASSTVREFKLWHKAEIFNDAGVTSLSSTLLNDTTYYYRLKICDNKNKCSISKCSSFTTATPGKCGFCNFVTRIKAPTGWTVSYDANQDGTYEHVQGSVCGANAGMKSNYTMGRSVNVKMINSAGTVYFEFINASLTKTALNDKVRTISDSGALIDTGGRVGLPADTRDKIINNLNPEACRVKIDSSTCTQLFHCDDSGNNCVDRTSEATLVDSGNCVWEIPFCEFSTYKTESAASSSSSSSGGGGGGGGGGGASFRTYVIQASQFSSGVSKTLNVNDSIKFKVDDADHTVKLSSIRGSQVYVRVASDPQYVWLSAGDTEKFDVTDDSVYDLSVTAESVSSSNASISIQSISEEVPEDASVAGTGSVIKDSDPKKEASERGSDESQTASGSLAWMWWVIGILLVVVVVVFVWKRNRT